MEIKIKADRIIEVLEGIKKKTKLDRYEEMVMTELITLLQEPEELIDADLGSGLSQPEDFSKPIKTPHEGMVVADKIAIVNQIMKKSNPKALEMRAWMKESIEVGQKALGIKTLPKSNSVEAFYDWLFENEVIEANGNPKGK